MSEHNIDKKVIRNLIHGDPAAFEMIFDKYHRKVYAFSIRNLRSKEDAEEVVQDVFYILWKDRWKLKELEDLDAWIFGICLNLIRKHFRRLAIEKKHYENLIRNHLEIDNHIDYEVEYRDLNEKVDMIIDSLPQRLKTIFLLHKNESLSNIEISEKLNISIRTVNNQLTNAKASIKKALIDKGLISLLFFCLFIHRLV